MEKIFTYQSNILVLTELLLIPLFLYLYTKSWNPKYLILMIIDQVEVLFTDYVIANPFHKAGYEDFFKKYINLIYYPRILTGVLITTLIFTMPPVLKSVRTKWWIATIAICLLMFGIHLSKIPLGPANINDIIATIYAIPLSAFYIRHCLTNDNDGFKTNPAFWIAVGVVLNSSVAIPTLVFGSYYVYIVKKLNAGYSFFVLNVTFTFVYLAFLVVAFTCRRPKKLINSQST